MMNDTFSVEWRRIWKPLTVSMSLAILIPFLLLMTLRYVLFGFDAERTFEHLSFQNVLLLICAILLFCAGFSFLAALWCRCACITLTEAEIHGRNYWGFRNRIPFRDITHLSWFSQNGIHAVVVHSVSHGQIHISDKTERLEELIVRLNSLLPVEQKFVFTAA